MLDIRSMRYTIEVMLTLHELFLSAEAGYVATPIAMVQAAMTLLNDASDLPKG